MLVCLLSLSVSDPSQYFCHTITEKKLFKVGTWNLQLLKECVLCNLYYIYDWQTAHLLVTCHQNSISINLFLVNRAKAHQICAVELRLHPKHCDRGHIGSHPIQVPSVH